MSTEVPEGLSERRIEELYQKLERPLYNVVYRWLWSSEEARDVVQEAFVRLWKMRKRVRPATVEPLLYRIAINLASNRRRSHRLWRWVSLEAVRSRPSGQGDALGRLEASERGARVRTAIEGLPERLRRVVTLCELTDLTYDEVGRILGIPAGTVGSRRNHALRRLRERLQEGEPDERSVP